MLAHHAAQKQIAVTFGQTAGGSGPSHSGQRSQPGFGEDDRATFYLKPYLYEELGNLIERVQSKTHSQLIALDHIQDPQNLGAICRSAEAFGMDALILPKDRSALVTPTVYHASAGAVATLPVTLVTNLGEALRRLKEAGYWILGSDLSPESQTPWQIPDFEKWVLVIGAEGEGISPLIRKLCDCLVKIPLPGKVQSLNASAATAALLCELTRPQAAGK